MKPKQCVYAGACTNNNSGDAAGLEIYGGGHKGDGFYSRRKTLREIWGLNYPAQTYIYFYRAES